MESLKRTAETHEEDEHFSETILDNEPSSLEESEEMISAHAIEKKLHTFHVEAQKMEIEISEIASHYNLIHKEINQEILSSLATLEYSNISNDARAIMEQPKNTENDLSKIALRIPVLEEYATYFQTKQNEFETEMDDLLYKKTLIKTDMKFASNNLVARLFGVSEMQKKEKELKDLEKKESQIKTEIQKAASYKSSLVYEKRDLMEKVNSIISSKVRILSNQLATKYQDFLKSPEDIDFLRNRALKDYLYQSLPPETADNYGEIKKGIDEGLIDFDQEDKKVNNSYVVNSKLDSVAQMVDEDLKESIGRISYSRDHKKVVDEVIAEDYMNQCQKMLKPLVDSGFDTTHALKYPQMNESESREAICDILKKSDRLDLQSTAIWSAVRDDSVFLKVFGQTIEELNVKKTEKVLDHGLRSGDGPFAMEFFPDRKVLDTLLVMFFSQTSINRVHTTNVLSRICKRDDWSVIIEDFLIEYPELKSVFDELGTVRKFDPISDDVFKNALENSNFAPDFFHKKAFTKDDPYSMKVTLEAMGTTNLMRLAIEKGILNDDQSKELSPALDIERDIVDKGKYYIYTSLSNNLRQFIIENLSDVSLKTEHDQKDQYLQYVLLPIARKISELDIENEDEIKKIFTHFALGLNNQISNTPEQLQIIGADLEKYKSLESIYNNAKEVFEYPEYQTQEGLDYLLDFVSAYQDSKLSPGPIIKDILKLINNDVLESNHALLILKEYSDLLDNKDTLTSVWINNPKYFLSSLEALDFARTCTKNYGINADSLSYCVNTLMSDEMYMSLLADLPKRMPAIINVKKNIFSNLLGKVLYNKDIFLSSDEAIVFANKIAGLYGNQAGKILDGYVECVKTGAIDKDQFTLVTEFLESYRVVSPQIIIGYKEAKAIHQEEFYFTEMNTVAEKMISSQTLSEKERSKPYCNDLIKHVYPQNSANWGSHEKVAACEDHSDDLAQYKIKKKYEIDLMSAGTISLKEGTTLDQNEIQKVQTNIFSIQHMFESVGYDPEKILTLLDLEIEKTFSKQSHFKNREEKIFAGLSEMLYSNSDIDVEKIKQLVMMYEFSINEDVREYIQGTSDKVSNASNKDYAILCELNEFYNDRVKEVSRRIIEKSYESKKIKDLMPDYFVTLAQKKREDRQKVTANRFQIDKLGISETFISQFKKTLEKRSKKSYSDAQIKRLITLYEKMTHGLQEKTTNSAKERTKAVYGQLKTQRDRTMNAVKKITGTEINPEELFLAEINLLELLNTENSIDNGVYNEDQFASYTVEKMINLFIPEQEAIESELSKFESSTGDSRKKLNAFITKTKESAHARMVGGVCVAGDNPTLQNKTENIWDMKNYLQMVFQDPETLVCQGLVLLHTEKLNNEEVLCASLNPSSTYLYTVNEEALFSGIMKSLETFADENGFSKIVVSSNKGIRTNRTGGEFEKAIDKRIGEMQEVITFDPPRPFSYKPVYNLSTMDVVWKKS